jgi:hypothetical protein
MLSAGSQSIVNAFRLVYSDKNDGIKPYKPLIYPMLMSWVYTIHQEAYDKQKCPF